MQRYEAQLQQRKDAFNRYLTAHPECKLYLGRKGKQLMGGKTTAIPAAAETVSGAFFDAGCCRAVTLCLIGAAAVYGR